MTMIDEGLLEQLLAQAAAEIEVPVDGAAAIETAAASLERWSFRATRPGAEAGDEEGHHTTGTVRRARSYRVAGVAASVLVVALIAVATLGHIGSSGSTSAHLEHKAVTVPAGNGSTGAFRAAGGASIGDLQQQNASLPPQLGSAGKTPSLSGSVGASGSPSPVTSPTGPVGGDVAAPKIESTGSMTLTVPHLDAAVSSLTALVAGDGGFVAAEQTQSASPGVPAVGTVTLQVPQTAFSTLVNQVKRLGVSSAVSTKQVDVTGQYVDLQAQITALKATQQQYLTIMTKAQSIGDVLAVQQQLDSINSQLQQVEGELNLLDSQTAYGTLTVSLTEPSPKPKPVPKPTPALKPPTGLAAAWDSARHGFANGVYWVVRQTGGLAFLVVLAGVLYLLGRVGRRGLRRLAL